MEKKLTYDQWKKLADQCEATVEAENDFSIGAGEHYKLEKVIREVGLSYSGDKYKMTRWAQKVLDNGYE